MIAQSKLHKKRLYIILFELFNFVLIVLPFQFILTMI